MDTPELSSPTCRPQGGAPASRLQRSSRSWLRSLGGKLTAYIGGVKTRGLLIVIGGGEIYGDAESRFGLPFRWRAP